MSQYAPDLPSTSLSVELVDAAVDVPVIGADPTTAAQFDGDATNVPYAPGTPEDWDTSPTDVSQALDELAGRDGGGGMSPQSEAAVAVSAVDGTATTFHLIAPSVGTAAADPIPAGWGSAVGFALPVSLLTIGAVVVVPGDGAVGAPAGMYRIPAGGASEPWEQIDLDVGELVSVPLVAASADDPGVTLRASNRSGVGGTVNVTAPVDRLDVVVDPRVPEIEADVEGQSTALGELADTVEGHTGEIADLHGSVDEHTDHLAGIEAHGDGSARQGIWHAWNLLTSVTRRVAQNSGTPEDAWLSTDPAHPATGIDVRALIRPAFAPGGDFAEILTLIADGGAGAVDAFEMAVFWGTGSDVFGNPTIPGKPYLFVESITGGDTEEGPNHPIVDVGLHPGVLAYVRLTIDFATETLTFWRNVAYGGDVETNEGAQWVEVWSLEHPQFGSIHDSGEAWQVGRNFWGDILFVVSFDGIDGTPLIAFDTADWAVGLGDLTRIDGLGNEWFTETGEIRDVLTIDAVADDDPRLSDAREPTGGAGGFLAGEYPDPGVNTEAFQDAVGAMAGDGLTYDDAAGVLNATAGGGGSSVVSPWFGSGVDGDVTISGTTTLTRDMYYNDLHVTGTLNPQNFKVFVAGTLSGNGTIACDGVASPSATAPASWASGTLGGGQFGTNGVAGAASASSALANRIGGNGGAGGAGSGGAGGAAPTGTDPTPANGGPLVMHNLAHFERGVTPGGVTYRGGTGGSGGGGDGVNTGGGGGSGAGQVYIAARHCTFTGVITAKGGNGATRATGNVGGGGGGGGGVVVVVTGSATQTFTTNVAGGTGGNGVGTGAAGSNGQAGTAIVHLEAA